jgi:hypothetical protein
VIPHKVGNFLQVFFSVELGVGVSSDEEVCYFIVSDDLDGNKHFIMFLAEIQTLKAFHEYFMSETAEWI